MKEGGKEEAQDSRGEGSTADLNSSNPEAGSDSSEISSSKSPSREEPASGDLLDTARIYPFEDCTFQHPEERMEQGRKKSKSGEMRNGRKKLGNENGRMDEFDG